MVMSCNKQDGLGFSTLCRYDGLSMYGRDDREASPNICVAVNKAIVIGRPILSFVMSVGTTFTKHEFGYLTSYIEFYRKACTIVGVACYEMEIASVVERTSYRQGYNVVRQPEIKAVLRSKRIPVIRLEMKFVIMMEEYNQADTIRRGIGS